MLPTGSAAGWRPRPFLVIFPSPGDKPVPLLRGAGADGVASLALAIRKQEGWYPGSISYRNNNPGNLVYVGQPGAVPGEGGFAAFPSADVGLSALERQITLDGSRGLTLGQFIAKYAPPSENDTAAYLASVRAQTGFAADALLSELGPAQGSSDDSAGVPASGDVEAAAGPGLGELAAGVAIATAIYLAASRL